MNLKEGAKVSTDIKSLIGIIIGVAVGVWAYFGIVEKLNQHSTTLQLMSSDFRKEYRI